MRLRRLNKAALFFGTMTLAVLIVSGTLFILDPHKQIRRPMVFLHEETMRETGEFRRVPIAHSHEGNMANYIEELLLGPAELRFVGIFPRGTRLNQVHLVDSTLYIDFSRELAFNLDNHPLTLVEIKRMVVDNLTMNFPELERTVITINGVEPDFRME